MVTFGSKTDQSLQREHILLTVIRMDTPQI